MWRGMAIPVLCVGMAGCGAEQAAQDVKEAVDPVAEAAEKTVASGGARLAGDVTMRLPEGELPMVLSGAASFEEDRVAIELDFPGRIPGLSQARTDRAREEAGFPLRQVSEPMVIEGESVTAIMSWTSSTLASPWTSRSPTRTRSTT